MKDFAGNVLEIGDTVAVAPKNYRGLVKAIVIAFTPLQVRLEYLHQGRPTQYLVYRGSVVKINVVN